MTNTPDNDRLPADIEFAAVEESPVEPAPADVSFEFAEAPSSSVDSGHAETTDDQNLTFEFAEERSGLDAAADDGDVEFAFEAAPEMEFAFEEASALDEPPSVDALIGPARLEATSAMDRPAPGPVPYTKPLSDLRPDAFDEPDDARFSARGSVPGTVLSLIFHVWLLLQLSRWSVENEVTWYSPPIESRIDRDIEEPPEEIESVNYELADPKDRELDVREVLNAASVGLSQTLQAKQESAPARLDELNPEMRQLPAFDIPEGLQVDDRMVVKGTTGESMIQIESALDLITWEIANNLRESRVLVVWLLDASGSLQKQKDVIAKRLRRVYGELDALQASTSLIPRHEQPLLTGVVTFGDRTVFLTENPTEKFEEVLEAIQSSPIDPSGVENVFGAVKQVVNNWSRYRTQQRRRIMVVTVTDEAGDDFSDSLEPAIAYCQRFGAKAYVIGPAAVFGRRQGFVPYVAPENGRTYRLPIDLGPETATQEVVELPFWYDGPQLDYLSSGYAPYALARLVHETGGVYFLTNMTTMSGLSPIGVFDSARLKPFAPDYSFGSLPDYERDLRKYPLRVAVYQAAAMSRQFPPNGTPRLDMRVTAGNFRQTATDAQKSVAQSQLMIDSILSVFPDGIEAHLDREPSSRWRMNFCLTYGRLLAQKARCQEYNYAFAWLKTNLANEDIETKSNHWIVKPDSKLNFTASFKKQADKGRMLLQRVVDEAPGTPFAVLAQRELQHGFGIQIEQRFIPPPPPAPPRPPGTPAPPRKVVLFADPPRPATPPPPPPKPPVLPRL